MTVFTDFSAFQSTHKSCVATIGKYDGLHIGHQHMLNTLCRTAKSKGLPSVVILSEPHPEEFFSGGEAGPRLTQFHDKVDFLLGKGVDAIFKMTFDLALSNLDAEGFIRKYLVEGLVVKTLIVGDDFRFGKNRKGDFSLLKEKGSEYGIDVIREISLKHDGHRVSSTLVRNSLEKGDCEKVRSLLGRYYSISGNVEEGKKLGRELGTPTANIALSVNKLPMRGIFSVFVNLKGQTLQGVASVGFNPTVENCVNPKLEVHIFDFNQDIYGEHLQVSFVKKLRDEITFPDLETLKTQISQDIGQAKRSLKNLQ